jgi:hypothetical protein
VKRGEMTQTLYAYMNKIKIKNKIYLLCKGGVIVTIPIRLILYIRSPPSSLHLNPLPTPLKAITRGFFVLPHISI